ncbi:MAG: sulfurtransferase, partial [Caulobacteraceae bacterium]
RDAPLTASCGSGVTASGVALALARLGKWDVAVYDGSWSEWGGRADAPVATGPATIA